jgi:hypothetical protein
MKVMMLLGAVGLPQVLSKAMNKIITISFLVIIFFACSRNEEVFETGTDYYPVRAKGSYIIYDVDQINYKLSGRDTESFQLKEMIGDTLTLNGQLYYKLLRFKRQNASVAWPAQPDSVWTTYKNASTAVKKENNIALIKMTFPVQEGKTWNGNGFNSWGAQDYTIRRLGYPYTVNGHYFDNTLMVRGKFDTITVINKYINYEVYAKGIGLVHKSGTNLELCQDIYCINRKTIYHIDSIKTGVKYEQRFNSYQ